MKTPQSKKVVKHTVAKTRKNHKSLRGFEQEVTVRFLEILNMVKLYHWKTHSFATHKATDELYDQLNGHIDTFMEVLLGKQGDRIKLGHVKKISLMDFNSVIEFKREMMRFKLFLVNMNESRALHNMSNSDLFNIRDEILADVNKFMYLLTLK